MTFAQKLKNLVEGESRARLARRAGLTPSMLNSYVNRGSEPLAGAALKLSKALGVPLNWLIDDDREEWPPPKESKPSAAQLPDEDLFLEMARRYRLFTVRMRTLFERLEKVDPVAVGERLLRVRMDEEIPLELRTVADTIYELARGIVEERSKFDFYIFASERHSQLPGSDRDPHSLDDRSMSIEYGNLLEKEPAWQLIQDYAILRRDAKIRGSRLKSAENERRKMLEHLPSAKKNAPAKGKR